MLSKAVGNWLSAFFQVLRRIEQDSTEPDDTVIFGLVSHIIMSEENNTEWK